MTRITTYGINAGYLSALMLCLAAGCQRSQSTGNGNEAVQLGAAWEEILNAAEEDFEEAAGSSESEMQPAVTIPADTPQDIPIFPEARPTMAFGKKTRTIRLESPESAQRIHDFYISELPESGWQLSHKALTNIQARKDASRHITVDVIEGETNIINIQYRTF